MLHAGFARKPNIFFPGLKWISNCQSIKVLLELVRSFAWGLFSWIWKEFMYITIFCGNVTFRIIINKKKFIKKITHTRKVLLFGISSKFCLGVFLSIKKIYKKITHTRKVLLDGISSKFCLGVFFLDMK